MLGFKWHCTDCRHCCPRNIRLTWKYLTVKYHLLTSESLISLYITNKWQKEWDGYKNEKLYEINPSVKRSVFHNFNPRHDQVVFTRCQLVHSRLTCGFLLIDEIPPLSLVSSSFDLKHILLGCNLYDTVRKHFYSETCFENFRMHHPNVFSIFCLMVSWNILYYNFNFMDCDIDLVFAMSIDANMALQT